MKMRQPEVIPQIVRIMAVALLCFAPVGAQAQLEPTTQLGSRIPIKPKVVDPVRAGLVKKGFAQCLYRRNSSKAPLLLGNSDPVTIDYNKLKMPSNDIGKYLDMETCLGEQVDETQLGIGLKFSPIRLRSMLQEEAYLAANKDAPILPLGSVESIDRTYISTGDGLNTAKGLGAFSDCLVFRDTKNADALLRAMPGSKEESVAAQALVPTLGACLVQGQTLSLTPSSIRTFAADGLWNRYVRSGSTVPGEVNEKP